MEPVKLIRFDPLYDGNMKLARELVRIVYDSKEFTLSEYPGRDEFYEEYLTKYDEYLAVLFAEAKALGAEDKINWECLDYEREALYTLAEEHRLTLHMFLAAYRNIGAQIDHIRNVYSKNRICSSVEESINLLISPTMKPNIVPFCSRTGAFGINTFLYMFFNKVYPIGVSTEFYPVHGGRYNNSIALTMSHDLLHYSTYTKFEKMGYTPHAYKLYQFILRDQDHLGEDVTKAFLYYLFVSVHETGQRIDCDKLSGEERWSKFLGAPRNAPDALLYLQNNEIYGPHNYGYNIQSEPETIPTYIGKAMYDISTDLCAKYGQLI